MARSTPEKWSARRALAFIVAASATLWMVILAGAGVVMEHV